MGGDQADVPLTRSGHRQAGLQNGSTHALESALSIRVVELFTGAYIFANLAGMLPGAVLYVYLGATARDALAAPSADFFQQLLNYVGLAATIVTVVVITRFARKALREAQERGENHER
jgi:hypothetical protein